MKRCAVCGDTNPDNYLFCGNCGRAFPASSGEASPTPAVYVISSAPVSTVSGRNGLTEQDRATILDKQIPKYVSQGFYVSARTPTTAQLVKPKRVSCFWLSLFGILSLAVIGLIPLILYLLVYVFSTPHLVYLDVDVHGHVHTKRN